MRQQRVVVLQPRRAEDEAAKHGSGGEPWSDVTLLPASPRRVE
jgi:hypothetical protein